MKNLTLSRLIDYKGIYGADANLLFDIEYTLKIYARAIGDLPAEKILSAIDQFESPLYHETALACIWFLQDDMDVFDPEEYPTPYHAVFAIIRALETPHSDADEMSLELPNWVDHQSSMHYMLYSHEKLSSLHHAQDIPLKSFIAKASSLWSSIQAMESR